MSGGELEGSVLGDYLCSESGTEVGSYIGSSDWEVSYSIGSSGGNGYGKLGGSTLGD